RCGTGLRIEAGDTVLLRCSSKRCKAGWEVRSSGRILGLRERAGDVTRRFYAAAFGVHGRGPASKLVGAAA
ncbi:MAG TPA: hypothetical protein VK915_08630, partial [Gaiellaceae bacterium]|nr:hypothetical protein [Gaiellaceae bacterium]